MEEVLRSEAVMALVPLMLSLVLKAPGGAMEKVVPLSTGLDRVRMNDALRGNGWGTGDSTGHGYGHSGWENGDGQGYGWSGGGYSGGSGRSHGDDAKQSTDE